MIKKLLINSDTSKHYFKINNTILWDCRQFIKEINNSSLLSIDAEDRSPIPINDSIINLSKIQINIKSTIHSEATSIDIVSAWKNFSNYFPIEKFLEVFMYENISKIKKRGIVDFEPDVIELLRLAYWFDKCSTLKNVEFKIKEIHYKLGKGLLRNFGKYDIWKSIEDYSLDDQLNSLINKQKRQIFSDTEKKQLDNCMKNWFKESFSFISELMSASLASKSQFRVSFDKINTSNYVSKHDYDFIIENFPIQVKTNTIYRRHSEVHEKLRQIGLEKEKIHSQRMKSIYNKHKDEGLSLDDVYNEILYSINSNKNEILKAVNKQGAKIVIYNGNQSSGGYALALYDLELNLKLSFENILKKCINQLINTNLEKIPLMFFSTGNYVEYHITALCFKIPFNENKLKIDLSSFEKMELM